MPSEPSSRRRGRGRGSPANPQPTQRRGRGSAAPRRRADDRLRAGYSRVVHFDVPIAGGREIISVDWRGERPESGRVPAGGLTVFVALGRDGRYSTDGLRGRFDTIDELLHAFGAYWPSPCAIPTPSQEQSSTTAQAGYASTSTRHTQSSTAAQAGSYPLYASTSTRHSQSSTVAQAVSYPLYASTSTRHAQSSTAAQAGSYPLYASTSAAAQDWPYAPVFTPSSAPVFAPTSEHAQLPTPYAHFSKMFAKYLPDCPPAYSPYSPTPSKEQHMDEPASAHTLQKLDVLSLEDSNNGPPGCRLSSSPIWNRSVFDWGITFYTTRDRTGSFHTYPDVGGPFQSLDEVNSAIDRYLIDNQDPTMCAGLSQVDAIVKRVRYYPDGTKKRGVKDKRRDEDYQLARALVDKYNDHHNLFGDLAYEVEDFLHGKPLWEDYYIHWTYFHMNFTAKTKGSYGVDTGNLFFAEVKCTRGDDALTVNSCCILEPSDHGLCYGCGGDVKHPNDGNAYACGRRNISYRFQNGAPELPPDYCEDRYYEDSDEEVERLRSQFKEDEEELKPLPMPLVV